MAASPRDLVRRAQMQAKEANKAAYEAEQQRRYNLYHDQYAPYLWALLKERNPKTWKEFSLVYINTYAMVVDARAEGLYDPEPERQFLVSDVPVPEVVQKRIDSMYRTADVNNVLDKAARYGFMHKTVAVQVVWRHNRVELDVLSPMLWDVVQGYPDPTSLEDAEAWIVHNCARSDTPGVVDEVIDTMWTWHPDVQGNEGYAVPQYYVFDGNGNITEQADNPYWTQDETGAYKWIVPASVLRVTDPDRDFFLPGGEGLADAALHVAYELTDSSRTIAYQSHGQPTFKGMTPEEAGTKVLSPTKGLALTEDQDFSYVAPPDTAASRDRYLDNFLARLARTFHLPADTFDQHRIPESGVARRIASGPLMKVRQKYAERLASFEADLFRKMVVVHNRHSAPANQIPEHTYVQVQPAKQVVPLDPTEQLEQDERRTALNVISPIDVIMREKGLSEEEAQKMYEANVQTNKALGTSGLRAAVQARQEARARAGQGNPAAPPGVTPIRGA